MHNATFLAIYQTIF